MLIRYIGRRTVYSVRYGRVPYDFLKENGFTLDIKDRQVVNYIFSMLNKSEFEVVEAETKVVETSKAKVKKTGGKSDKRKKRK